MKVLVTGAAGQLGGAVCRELGMRGFPYEGIDIGDCDLTDPKQTTAYIERARPDAVIHCAAYTAVDRAETEKEQCYAVNENATLNVAEACARIGAAMMYISTDYVFDGTGEVLWETDARTNPLSVYGDSKLRGERAVIERLQRFYIVRTSWVYGDGGNFVRTMCRLGVERDQIRVVSDQVGSPTYADDLAGLLMDMIQTEKYGIYHATNEGYCSWYEFACKIKEHARLPAEMIPVTTDEYGAAAQRPRNSRLSKRSLEEAGFSRLPHWEDALGRYLRAIE